MAEIGPSVAGMGGLDITMPTAYCSLNSEGSRCKLQDLDGVVYAVLRTLYKIHIIVRSHNYSYTNHVNSIRYKLVSIYYLLTDYGEP